MAMLSSAAFHRLTSSSPSISPSTPLLPPNASPLAKYTTRSTRNSVYFTSFALQKPIQSEILLQQQHQQEDDEEEELEEIVMADGDETVLYSVSPLPLLVLAALPGGN